jgi:hypothetical protein
MSERGATLDAAPVATAGRGLAFQVRLNLLEIAGSQHRLSASSTQALLGEVNRLPRAFYPAADELAKQIERTLGDGSNVRLYDEQGRTLLVAIERIRLRSGRLPAELSAVRTALHGASLTAP